MKLIRKALFNLLTASLILSSSPTSSTTAARAQSAAPPGPITPTAVAPDRKAYLDANRISDSKKKIEALQKFLTDFPKSSMLYSAHMSLMNTLIKNAPEQKEDILQHAHKAIDAAPEFARKIICNQVAGGLIEANIMLDKAEEFAARALAIAEEEQAKSMRQSRASYQTIIGRIELKKGKTKDAEKAFKAAYDAIPPGDANPTRRTAALGLAEIAEKEGKYDQALPYLAMGAISGPMDASARARLETAYKKTHNDSAEGLEGMLDALYEKEFPSPIKVEPYKPTAARTDRTVLSEVFTGAGCPPCVGADLAFDAFLERYRNKDVIVMMYHQHIPLPDPMTNPSTLARARYYGVRGVPSFAIDGDSSNSGGGSRSMALETYDRLSPLIEKQLESPSEAEIKLKADVDGRVVRVTANVASVKRESGEFKLQLALVEESIRFNGENGIRFHPMVVRSLAGANAGGFALDRSKLAPIEWRFDLNAITEELKNHLDEFEKGRADDHYTFAERKNVINPANLCLVAFVQDDKTKQVLQAVTLKVGASQTVSTR